MQERRVLVLAFGVHRGHEKVSAVDDGIPVGLALRLVRVVRVAAPLERDAVLRGFADETPVRLALEVPVLLVALAHHAERRCLHPSEGEHALRPAGKGERPRGVDADDPVGLAPEPRGVGEVVIVAVGFQVVEAVLDGLVGERRYPKPLCRLPDADVLVDAVEDELPLPRGIGGADDAVALAEKVPYHLEPVFRAGVLDGMSFLVPAVGDGSEVEPLGDDRQVVEPPPSLGFGNAEFEKVPLAPRDAPSCALEPVLLVGRGSEDLCQLPGDIPLFCYYNFHFFSFLLFFFHLPAPLHLA